MARRSPTPVSCLVLMALMCGAISPLMAQAREGPCGLPSDTVSSTMVSALARQIAFVKSFSAVYPCQFRQGRKTEVTGTIAVDEIKMQGK